jgi:hypothetical protein
MASSKTPWQWTPSLRCFGECPAARARKPAETNRDELLIGELLDGTREAVRDVAGAGNLVALSPVRSAK